MSQELTTERLDQLEAFIQSTLKQTMDMFSALREIRDDRLFEQVGYERFEDYCQDRWGLTPRYCNYNLKAIEMREVVAVERPEAGTQLTTERQYRALLDVPDGMVGDVVDKAREIAGDGAKSIPSTAIEKAKKELGFAKQRESSGTSGSSEPPVEAVLGEDQLEKCRLNAIAATNKLRRELGFLNKRVAYDAVLVDILRSLGVSDVN